MKNPLGKLMKAAQAAKAVLDEGGQDNFAELAALVNEKAGDVGQFLGGALQADLDNSLTDRPAVKYAVVDTGVCSACGAGQKNEANRCSNCGSGWQSETKQVIQ